MKLLSVRIRNFRNIEEAHIVPSPWATVVVGQNGQGKTNLLEAIYALATLRPLRASRFDHLIRFGCESARIEGDFLIGDVRRTIAFDIGRDGRTAWVDGKKALSLSDYFGGVSIVAFTPDDLSVIKGGPEGRRRFLDRAVFNRFPSHLDACKNYLRALKQRNQLLRDRGNLDLLGPFDVALAKAGAEVIFRRLAWTYEIAPQFSEVFEAIAPGDGGAFVSYAPLGRSPADAESTTFTGKDASHLAAQLLSALQEKLPRDMERGFTSVGPHTDDLEIRIHGKSAKSFASQGQQRAIVLAFKIAELKNLEITLRAKPLLLLDDVSSELDPKRNGFLMEHLRRSAMQCILTTTDARLVLGNVLEDDCSDSSSETVSVNRVLYRVKNGVFEVDDG